MKNMIAEKIKFRQFILIADIAYVEMNMSEDRIKHWMDLYLKDSNLCCCPLIKKLKRGELVYEGASPEHLKGGNKYIVIDGRHRIVARKRLGFDVVECHVVEIVEKS